MKRCSKCNHFLMVVASQDGKRFAEYCSYNLFHGGRGMSYNIGVCRDCKIIVERNAANLCYDCWCIVDSDDHGCEEE